MLRHYQHPFYLSSASSLKAAENISKLLKMIDESKISQLESKFQIVHHPWSWSLSGNIHITVNFIQMMIVPNMIKWIGKKNQHRVPMAGSQSRSSIQLLTSVSTSTSTSASASVSVSLPSLPDLSLPTLPQIITIYMASFVTTFTSCMPARTTGHWASWDHIEWIWRQDKCWLRSTNRFF